MSKKANLPSFCPMNCGKCNLPKPVVDTLNSTKPFSFGVLPYDKIFDDTSETMKKTVEGGLVFSEKFERKELNGNKLNYVEARNIEFVGNGTCSICQLCWFSDFGIAELGKLNPNVLVEIGLLWGFGKPVIFTLHKGYTRISEIPFDLQNHLLVPYQSVQKLSTDLESKIEYVLSIL